MATYVNNLRLKEIATGDESGTWGTSTNTNLELSRTVLATARSKWQQMPTKPSPCLTLRLMLLVVFT
jgi:hypothetical protein